MGPSHLRIISQICCFSFMSCQIGRHVFLRIKKKQWKVSKVSKEYTDVTQILAKFTLLELQANMKADPQTHAHMYARAHALVTFC